MKSVVRLLVLMLPIFTCSVSRADGWQAYMYVGGNYFEGVGSNTKIVLMMSSAFHTCGWNEAVEIDQSAVGDASFKNLTAVVLTALTTGRSLSVFMSGCDGDRANVIGLRLGT